MSGGPIAPLERLERLPEPKDLPLLADWIEVRCFLAPDLQFFSEELKGPLDELKDLGEGPVPADLVGMVATNEMYFGRDAEEALLDTLEEAVDQQAGTNREEQDPVAEEDALPDVSGDDLDEIEDDAEDAFTDDVLTQMLSRLHVLDEDYPFEIATEAGIVRLRDEVTDRQKVYLGLLAASCLAYVPGKQDVLTSRFERLGKVVLERYLGGTARVEIFGTKADEGELFSGDLRERLKKLSKAMRLELQEGAAEEVSSSGDHGLDLVAWWPLDDDDPAFGQAIMWAQSGCGKDWPAKQGSAAAANWVNVFIVNVDILTCVLIPYWYRESGGAWYRKTKIAKNIVLDRRRILWLLRNEELPLEVFPGDALDGLMGQGPPSAVAA